MRPGPSPETIDRIETAEHGPIVEILRRCYISEQLPYRKLCARWGINNRTLMRLLKHCGIAPRKGGDAVRTQWIDNDARRKRTGQKMRETVRRINRAGRHPRLGKTKENCETVRRLAEHLRTATSMRRPEVAAKGGESHALFIRRDPGRHVTSLAAPTKAEAEMLKHIRELGFQPVHNQIVHTRSGPKWINAWVPKLNLGISCESFGRFPLPWERHAAISALGIRHVFMTNYRIMRGYWNGLDHYIALLQVIRPHPTVHRENTVIWGRRNPAVFKGQPDEVAAEAIAVDVGHEILITVAADDPVLREYRSYVSPS